MIMICVECHLPPVCRLKCCCCCCGYHDYANRTGNQSYIVVSVVGGYVSGQMSGNTNDLMHHSLDEAFLKGVWGWWMVMRMVERFFSRRVLTVLIQVYEEEAHI